MKINKLIKLIKLITFSEKTFILKIRGFFFKGKGRIFKYKFQNLFSENLHERFYNKLQQFE